MSPSPPLAEVLGEFAARFTLADAIDRTWLRERAQLHLLDAVGLALVGWLAEDGLGDALLGLVGGGGGATIIGRTPPASAPVAALANATLATAWSYDDIDPVAVMHCEAFAGAATLAVAECLGRGGEELAEAFVVAVEVALRLASAVPGSRGLYDAGFHSTSVFGCLGAAAGAAKLLRLGPDGTADALALAVSFASGTSAGWTFGSGRNKTLQPGWAAHGGVIAAQLAAAGVGCSHETIDGPRGLLAAHIGDEGWAAEPVLDGLGARWLLDDLQVKRFPCGSAVQPAAACAHRLHTVDGVRGEDVTGGVITVPRHLGSVLGDLGEALYRPASGVAAMGSFPLVVAALLRDGRYTLKHRTDAAIRSEGLLALADKIAVRAATGDGDQTSVEIETGRGRFVTTAAPESCGREGVVAKFEQNAGLVLAEELVPAIRDTVLDLGAVPDVRRLTGLLQKASAGRSP